MTDDRRKTERHDTRAARPCPPILWLLLAYAVVLPPLIWLRATQHVGNGLLLAMAIAASLPVLGIFASWGRYVSDERDSITGR